MILVRQASPEDSAEVSGVLNEAAEWLRSRGEPMWRPEEISADAVAEDLETGLYFLAEVDGATAGVVKFQLEDPRFWPDIPATESAFIHRFAVRRAYAGGAVSEAIIRWAAERGRRIGRTFLRLDCDPARPRLRAVYERLGFRYHSDQHVDGLLVARYELELR
jgi:GNAT superfamily N-acetyltransferase